jgi:II/X family phage/plasmid replication protein
MIDTLEIAIPFGVDFVQVVNGRHEFVDVDLKELDIPLGAKAVYWNDDGEQRTEALYSPYKSLETSFTGMACKVNLEGYFYPHVLIEGSPAKIMQGHNVFGTDNLESCVKEMLWFLKDAYPT